MKPVTKYHQKPEDAARVQRDPNDDAPRTRQGNDGKRGANALRATIVGNWEEPSGESRLISTWPA